ncbi:T9SS type A sorting domain-containing protein [bacterium]|nr:T9SS type A sorting domain-containing protein [bacterium]
MKKLASLLVFGLFLLSAASSSFGQDYTRRVVAIPKVDPAAITIDGKMNEPEWQTAGRADLVTATSYEIWANYYGRESLTAPDYEQLYARMLWKDDTLYVFVHIDEVVNDSTDLFWRGRTRGSPYGQWCGDQLFLSLSNRLGDEELGDQYDGNVWTAPEGPYHFLILGEQITLNDSLPSYNSALDSSFVYNAADIARWATFIDPATGVWDIELAIYNPNIKLQTAIGFNLGGSAGSSKACDADGDAYAYYTWQPSVPDDPFAVPPPIGDNDPGFHNLRTSEYWALLQFVIEAGTAVESGENGNGVPVRFALRQNYPNPFNPSTTIRFDVTKNVPVTLRVYNSLGQLVATLLNARPFAVGTYEVNWNAGALTSGVYFYRLEAGGASQTKRMVLMR